MIGCSSLELDEVDQPLCLTWSSHVQTTLNSSPAACASMFGIVRRLMVKLFPRKLWRECWPHWFCPSLPAKDGLHKDECAEQSRASAAQNRLVFAEPSLLLHCDSSIFECRNAVWACGADVAAMLEESRNMADHEGGPWQGNPAPEKELLCPMQALLRTSIGRQKNWIAHMCNSALTESGDLLPPSLVKNYEGEQRFQPDVSSSSNSSCLGGGLLQHVHTRWGAASACPISRLSGPTR
eukprot:730693-Amphidinium_carterae.2